MTTYNKIYKHQNKSCFYCNEEQELHTMEKEHVYPRSKGGKGIRNKVLSCHFCNQLKGNLTIRVFGVLVDELLVGCKDRKLKTKLENISSTLTNLNNGQEIRKNWHKKSTYKTNDINKVPVR